MIKNITLKLRHYGSSRFEWSSFHFPRDVNWIKPNGGLWACPLETSHGWKDFLIKGKLPIPDVYFDFTYTGKTLVIDGPKDLRLMEWNKLPMIITNHVPVFTKVIDAGIDAIYLTERGFLRTKHSKPLNLFGWDCESVLILNPFCVSQPTIHPIAHETTASRKQLPGNVSHRPLEQHERVLGDTKWTENHRRMQHPEGQPALLPHKQAFGPEEMGQGSLD